MLHLLPVRLVLQVFAVLVAITVVAASYAGWVGKGDPVHDMAIVIRWSSGLATAAIVLLFISWRWVQPVQRLIFPYLGGRWSGVLRFDAGRGPSHRDVRLEIKHTLFGIRLLLDSDESTSSTLVVHAERNPDFQRYRIYYVYLNERKEGVPGAGDRYRGLAVLRVEWGPQPELQGNYFTEANRSGTLHLKQDERYPWWKLWR
jgi:SMODS-associating 2TM, beta-strand rich effector domain